MSHAFSRFIQTSQILGNSPGVHQQKSRWAHCALSTHKQSLAISRSYYWHTSPHIWTSKTCSTNESRDRKIYTLWFHLYGTLEEEGSLNCGDGKQVSGYPGPRWAGADRRAEQGSLQGARNIPGLNCVAGNVASAKTHQAVRLKEMQFMETAIDPPNKDLICSVFVFFFFNFHDLNTLRLISARKWRGVHTVGSRVAV